MEPIINILLVDDKKENLIALKSLLYDPNLDIMTATSGNEALGLMLEYDFAVVLLDVQMPEMDGFEVAELMRRKEKTKYIPIIFVTAINKEEKYIFKGYETGAVDYLFKPLDPVVLKSKIGIFLELHKHKQELEKSRDQIKKQNEQLKEMSIRDGLTNLYNYRYFQEMLTREFALASRKNLDISCFMIDLDYFKAVNDTYGHLFGDYVLKTFAALFTDVIRKTDIFARYGGEEFVLLLPHTTLDGARVLAEKIRQKAEKYVYEFEGHSKCVTASIGIATCFSHHPETSSELLTFADRALYHAKAAGRNQVRIFKEEELIRSGALKEFPKENLYDLRNRLKKVLENTRGSVLNSLETLLLPVDSVVTLTTTRNYRPALTQDEAIREMVKQAGRHFDPLLVKNLMDIIEEKEVKKENDF